HDPLLVARSGRPCRSRRRPASAALRGRPGPDRRPLVVRRAQGGQKNYVETDDEGQFWRTTVIEIETRLRVGRGIAKTEQQASAGALRQLKRRGHPQGPPPLVSDGFGSNREAILLVYGQVPPYKGIGRPPTRRRPVEGLRYLQVVKHHDERGRFLGTTKRVVFGPADEVASLSEATSFVERKIGRAHV